MKTLFVLLLSICIISCNKETIQNEHNSENAGSEKLNFQYKGIDYASTFKRSADNTIVLDDQDVNNIYQKISNLPELASLVHPDGYTVFFDNPDDLQQAFNLTTLDETNQTISTKSFTSGILTAYTSFDFNDFNILFTHDFSGFRNLKEIGSHNDKMTGFSTICTRDEKPTSQQYMIGLFEHISYKGQSIWFYIKESNPNLIGSLNEHTPDLSNKVSSLQFSIVD